MTLQRAALHPWPCSFYVVRLAPSERTQQKHVQTAARARCLVQSDAPREALTLHLNGDGTVSALEYASNCSAVMTSTQLPRGWQLKQEVPVHVKWPPRADILRPVARPQTGEQVAVLSPGLVKAAGSRRCSRLLCLM